MMAVYDPSDWLDIGRYEYQRNLQHYRDYLQLSDAEREQAMVSGYHQDERVLPVPAWVSTKHEQRGFDEY